MRISSPPTTHSCFYGIDTPERSKLLAARHNVEEMAALIGADSLAFISIDGLYRALGRGGRDAAAPHYCDACFTGEYPVPLPDMDGSDDRQLSLLAEHPVDGLGAAEARKARGSAPGPALGALGPRNPLASHCAAGSGRMACDGLSACGARKVAGCEGSAPGGVQGQSPWPSFLRFR